MGYESLHIMELLSVQCLQVDNVIRILLPAVYCGFGRCALLFDGYINSIQVVFFSNVTIEGSHHQ